MTIDEIFDRILLRSGQFILRKSKIEIDIDSFRILVEDALADYSGFVPHTEVYTLDLNNVTSGYIDFVTPAVVAKGDTFCFVTKTGTGGSGIVMSAILAKDISGLKGEDGIDAASFFDGGTWDTTYQPDQIIDGGGW